MTNGVAMVAMGLEKEEEEAVVVLEGGTPIIVYFSSFAVTINYIICGAKY